MRLNRHARSIYALRITTEPAIPAADWEASFDRGKTWHPAAVDSDDDGDWSTWLLAGPLAEVGDAVAVIPRALAPTVRAIDNPEILAEDAPRVTVF